MVGHPAFAGAFYVAANMLDWQAGSACNSLGTFGPREPKIFEALAVEGGEVIAFKGIT